MADLWTQLYQTKRYQEKSAPNTESTLNTPPPGDERCKLIGVFVTYSSAVTGDVVVTLNSGLGSNYDVTLATISLTAEANGYYLPDGGPMQLAPDDVISVVAAAGGGVIASHIAVTMDRQPLVQEGYMEG